MKIAGHTALITGAASGMGAETAKHLSKLGAKVVLFDKDANACHTLGKILDALAYEVDVTQESDITRALKDVVQKIEAPRILINCAGIAPAKRMVNKKGAMPQTDFETVLRINLFGTFNMMRLVAEKMSALTPIEECRGVIINTSSIAAFEGQTGQTAYAASKAAIAGLTLPAARDLSIFGIRVMTIAPGVMSTPMMMSMPEDVRKKLENIVPFPKRLGMPQEFAFLVGHIIENDYLNGSVIRLDGGLRMPYE